MIVSELTSRDVTLLAARAYKHVIEATQGEPQAIEVLRLDEYRIVVMERIGQA